MAFLIGGANSAAADAGYDVDNSLRFNDDDGAYLQRTAGANTGEDNATLSFWFKLGNIKSDNNGGHIMTEGGTTGYTIMQIYAQKIYIGSSAFGTMFPNLIRDPSAWYHLFVAFDSSQATDTNRVKAYLNGVLLTDAVTFTDYPDQNENLDLCVDGNTTRVGSRGNSGAEAFDGYLAEFHFLDGTTKAYTDFGEFDEDSGIWKPKEYTGGSYGNNGFFLEFKQSGTGTNSSGMGADTSGNDNHFAVTSLAATDQCTDTPTNNFCTLNPLNQDTESLSEGNLKIQSRVGASGNGSGRGTIGFSSGKWYAEYLYLSGGVGAMPGISPTSLSAAVWEGHYYAIHNGNKIRYVGNTYTDDGAFGDTLDADDILGIAMDADNNTIAFYKNNVLQGGGNAYTGLTDEYIFSQSTAGGDENYGVWNFGNPPVALDSGNADANGYGNFEYEPPNGFYALCTKNLAEYG